MAAANPNDPIGAVLADGYKKPFMLLVAAVSIATLVLLGLSKAETFVDGRIELKMSAAKERSEEQAVRLAKVEEQFASMKDTLAEIRADVRVLRARVEGADSDRAARSPASAHP